jgi:hypothetical protein
MTARRVALSAPSAPCARLARAPARFLPALIPQRAAHAAAVAPAWRPSSALDEYACTPIAPLFTHLTRHRRWVQREARPISLRRLTFFGRTLTESRLLDGANYCRLELPIRSAHQPRFCAEPCAEAS